MAYTLNVEGLPNIAFGGPAGAGKDTAGAFLVDVFGYFRIAWADRLKDIVEYIWDEDARRDRRKITSIGRAIEAAEGSSFGGMSNALGYYTVERIDASLEAGHNIVVTDTRFESEFVALAARGFVMVRITCDRDTQIQRLTRTGKLQDELYLDSEIEHMLDGAEWDYTYENSGTQYDLGEFVAHVLRKERA